MAITQTAHQVIQEHFSNHPALEKHIAVDATSGNGHDTKFIYELGFKNIYAFDIQKQAQEQTRLTTQDYKNVTIIPHGHETMQEHIPNKAQLIMFNLGYLPSSDKTITTLSNTTIIALEQTLDLLDKKGLLSIICYPGHEEGKTEAEAVKEWINDLNKDKWSIKEVLAEKPTDKSPLLYLTIAK